jgi:hypothetical protein
VIETQVEITPASSKQWHSVRDGAANDLDDWVALLAEFASGATVEQELRAHSF